MADSSKVIGTAMDRRSKQSRPWALGDYGRVAMALQPVADRLIARLGDLSGQEVLDVATGTGNVALAAARAGASVLGVDVTHELLALARVRTDASGLRVDYRLGDAEALPVKDESFDVVASAFGVMFAANHQRTADELVRACRPGGTIALVNWVPDGALATFAGLISATLPSPPCAASPGLWGRESYVRSLLEPRGVGVEFFNEQVTWEAESAEAYLAIQRNLILDNGTDKGRDDDAEVGAGGRMDAVRVLAAYDEGVKAIETVSPAVADWNASTPCAAWRSVDLAGHVLCIARYYHRLLDAALTGHPLSGLPRGEALVVMNGQDLSELPETSGPERISDFVRTATAYGDRLRDCDWETSIGAWAGIGRLTIAEHVLLAVGEWHIHGWDLARAAEADHQPSDPEVVLASLRILPGSLPDGEPWGAALRGAGRFPSWKVRG